MTGLPLRTPETSARSIVLVPPAETTTSSPPGKEAIESPSPPKLETLTVAGRIVIDPVERSEEKKKTMLPPSITAPWVPSGVMDSPSMSPAFRGAKVAVGVAMGLPA
jgi:hypothetical protein